MFISTVYQSESAVHILIPSLFLGFPSQFRLPQSIEKISCVTYNIRLSLVIYFTQGISSVYVSIPVSQFISSPFPLDSHTSVLFICVSVLQVKLSVQFSFRFHIDALVHDVCFLFATYSLCLTPQRCIHISTDDPVWFLFMAK